MSDAWPASQRYGLDSAPGGLGLVQDFLNTSGIEGYGPDLLADPARAAAWVAGAVRTWARLHGRHVELPVLAEADLARLRALRATIGSLVAPDMDSAQPGVAVAPVAASLTLSDTGEVRLEPAGAGWRWLASALCGEILLSQHAGTWRRVKRCRNHRCASTFYDRSKNNSGVWHDVKTCGNAANLRASRARRRERERANES
ncbi:CGNR zinc finger domain-containing protein [Mycobacterium sp. Marseille-P9652]|uniref:CGNR zinc finger domain-containing protein n=1 Tax=Mycobacterium sp. Marseille-P9652 TaxID=2654950 RepID=UPI0012E71EF6|nr:CGNR zinc finger domain-containing protein [Mycobacterium sp. Marseille-P9652]